MPQGWQLVYMVVRAAVSGSSSRAAQRASFSSGWAVMSLSRRTVLCASIKTSPCRSASSEPYGSSPVVTAVLAMPIARRKKVRSSAVIMTMSPRQATAAMAGNTLALGPAPDGSPRPGRKCERRGLGPDWPGLVRTAAGTSGHRGNDQQDDAHDDCDVSADVMVALPVGRVARKERGQRVDGLYQIDDPHDHSEDAEHHQHNPDQPWHLGPPHAGSSMLGGGGPGEVTIAKTWVLPGGPGLTSAGRAGTAAMENDQPAPATHRSG